MIERGVRRVHLANRSIERADTLAEHRPEILEVFLHAFERRSSRRLDEPDRLD